MWTKAKRNMAFTGLPKYTKLPDKMPKIEKGNEATDKGELNKTQKLAAGGPVAIGKEGNKIETLAVRNVSKDDVIAKKTGQRIMKDNAYRIGIDTGMFKFLSLRKVPSNVALNLFASLFFYGNNRVL